MMRTHTKVRHSETDALRASTLQPEPQPSHGNSTMRPSTAPAPRFAQIVAAAGLLATLIIFAAAHMSSSPAVLTLADNIHWTLAFTVAAVLAWLGVNEAAEEHATVRRWLAWGLTSNALGQVVWEVAEFFGVDPFPAPSDAFFLTMGVCFSAGMISILRSVLPTIEKSSMLDVSSLALVVLTLTLDLYLPQMSTLRPSQIALMVAYPIALLLPGCICIVLAPTMRWRFDHRWTIFLVSSIANGALWMQWNRLTVLDRLQDGTWLNLSFSVVALAMGYGAYAWRTQVNAAPAWERRCELGLRLIPLIVVGAAVISVAIVWVLPDVLESVQLATCVGAALVIGLAVARQNLLLIERDRMASAEQRARASESRLGAVFATIRDGVAVFDANGKFIDANPACETLFAYGPGELHGLSIECIDAASAQHPLRDHFARARVEGGALFDAQCRTKDGRVVDIEVSASAAPEGATVIATFRDITERKRAQERVEALAKRVSIATSAANMGIWEVDAVTGHVTWDDRMYELHGRTPGQFDKGTNGWGKCVHAEDRERIVKFWTERPMSPGYGTISYRYLLPNGETRHIHVHALWQYENGRLERVTGVNFDITDLKRTEEQLRGALRDLSLATDAAQLAVATWYVQEARVVCDRRMFELYGVEPVQGDTTPEYLWKHIHPEDRLWLRDRFKEGHASENEFSEEYRVRLPSGEMRWIECRASVQYDGSIAVRMTGVHWDITERKRAEKERLQLEAQLRQAQKLEALGTLAGGIAHDFNNILGAILGNAELAGQDLGRAHPTQESLAEIRKASLRGKELVQRLLAFGRPQDQRRERLHLQSIIEDSLKLLRAAIPRTVEMTVNVEADAPPVLIDAVQISQIIVNLGMNAYQALNDHKGRIVVGVSTKHVEKRGNVSAALDEGRYVCLSVQDDGVGMSAATLEHVFEPFFTTKSLGQGTGLGLAVVHGIVRAHDGVVNIDSALGRGTRFDIYLPVAPDIDAPRLSERVQSALAQGRGQHILYLDDEEPLVFLARRLLERMGYRTSGYTEPSEALRAFRNHPADYDLFITDLSMPQMSGMEVAKEVLRIHPKALVVLASGYVRAQDIEEARAIGVRDVILKPNTVEELTHVVHTLLSELQA